MLWYNSDWAFGPDGGNSKASALYLAKQGICKYIDVIYRYITVIIIVTVC